MCSTQNHVLLAMKPDTLCLLGLPITYAIKPGTTWGQVDRRVYRVFGACIRDSCCNFPDQRRSMAQLAMPCKQMAICFAECI